MSLTLILGIICGAIGIGLCVKISVLSFGIIKNGNKMEKKTLQKKIKILLVILPIEIVVIALGLIFFRMDYYDYVTLNQFIVTAKYILLKRVLRISVIYFVTLIIMLNWLKKLRISDNIMNQNDL